MGQEVLDVKHALNVILRILIDGNSAVIVCYDTGNEKAYALAEGLRRIISDEPFGKIGQITCSIGVTTINADDSFDDAFNRMDRALYNAKSSGRNCVKSV